MSARSWPRTRRCPRPSAIVAAVAGALPGTPPHVQRVLAAAPYPPAPSGALQRGGDRAGDVARARSPASGARTTSTRTGPTSPRRWPWAASTVSGIPWSFTAHRYDVVLNNLLTEKLRSARFGRFIAREMLAVARPLVRPDAMRAARCCTWASRCRRAPRGSERARVPVVLCPARLVPMKGHRHLLDAAAQLMARGIAFELWLAGDGPESAAIAERSTGLVSAIAYGMLGIVPHAELLRLYREREVDCVVLPSVDLGGGLHEGISVALIEAMAHGVPAIATGTGGLPELLDDGAGVLVPPATPTRWPTRWRACWARRRSGRSSAQRGRRRIEEEFDVAAIARELVSQSVRRGDAGAAAA